MKNIDLTKGNIKKHLIKLSIPTMGGMFAFTIFNITDTYFVSKLGTEALAAMGYTFPVVMIIGAMASGMSLGAGSVLARAMGNKDHHLMKRIATDGILLSIIAVILITMLGLLTMDPLFRLLGASEETIPLIKEYMFTWYIGIVAVIMPPVSDSAMRAVGDMIRPLIVMLTCAFLNLILDPILIFGWFGLPALGIQGAALATVISRAVGMILTLSFIHFHHKLLDFKYESFKELIDSWKRILHIGIPSSFVRLFPQLLRSLLTYLASGVGGNLAVAAIAAGTRIESFSTIVSMSIGTSLIPLVGQNFGAKKYDRVEVIRKLIIKTAIFYSLLVFIIFLPLAGVITKLFSTDLVVIEYTKWYLWIMLFGAIGLNMYNWLSQALNASGKPYIVMKLNVLGTIFILMPLAYIGSIVFDFKGMLLGLCTGQLILGFISIKMVKQNLNN